MKPRSIIDDYGTYTDDPDERIRRRRAFDQLMVEARRVPLNQPGFVDGKMETIRRLLAARAILLPWRHSTAYREIVWKLEWDWFLAERQLDCIVWG